MKKIILLAALLTTGFIIEKKFEEKQNAQTEQIQLSNNSADSTSENGY